MDLCVTVSLTVLSVLIVAANLFVISLVCLNRVPRTYTNWLTVSLAVSDVLTGGILFPMLIMRPTHVVVDYFSSNDTRQKLIRSWQVVTFLSDFLPLTNWAAENFSCIQLNLNVAVYATCWYYSWAREVKGTSRRKEAFCRISKDIKFKETQQNQGWIST